jgi:Phage portal protein
VAGPTDFIGRLFRRGRRRLAPQRETEAYPRLVQLGSPRDSRKRASFKPVARNLRYFSRTPYARRAINAIKNPITNLEWEVAPLKGVKANKEIDRQIEVATYCLNNPNADDSWRSLVEQVVEDVLCGAGAIEHQLGADESRPLWLWPVDGLSIQMFAGWDGSVSDPRYYQTSGYGGVGNLPNDGIQLRNDELIYIRPNPSTADPFGIGPVEIAFLSIARQLGVADFAGNVASNARPSMGFWFKDADDAKIAAARAWWRNEIEGQGGTPMFGAADMEVLRFWPEGDKALYLAWQEFLIREIATAFDLSPQNLGVERDVNRNTSEVAEDRDWDAVIIPMASLISAHLTREALHAKLGFHQVQHRFVGLDREDEEATARIFKQRWETNSITPNQIREHFGEEPMPGSWGDKTWADVQIAIKAAQGAKTVDDPDITPSAPTNPPPRKE